MKKVHIVLIGIFTAVILVMFGCQFSRIAGLKGKKAPQYKIVGYASGVADVSAADADMLTHIIYAFARIDENGQLFFPDPEASSYIERLVLLKSEVPYLKVLCVDRWMGCRSLF